MSARDEEAIVSTSGKRLALGMAVLVGVMAAGAAIALPNWHNFASHPPPVSQIAAQQAAQQQASGGATAPAAAPGTTSITILPGANVQGNPNFSPDDDKVPLTNKIVWVNKDTTPHTATSGTGASDPKSGKVFDTKIIANGQSSPVQHLTGVKAGDVVPYYCQIHPYMTGKITVTG
jgi:plastocyanin